MATVVLSSAVKIYPRGVRAIDGLDLAIADGELLVILGPSGCGKSTLLRAIAGLDSLTSGRVEIGGRDVTHRPPHERNVSMVFQHHALYPHLAVESNLRFGLRLRKIPPHEIDARVKQVAASICIESLLDRMPRELSGGERQRVAIGQAMVRRPDCQLLDEPLSHLDARLRAELRTELKRLHAHSPTTTIHVTHDQEEAMTMADRIAVMRRGRIEQCDVPLAIYRRPANSFVAAFIGAPPMNLISGQLIERDGSLWFERGPARLRVPDWARNDVAARRGSDIVLGIRPEAVSLQPLSAAVVDSLETTVLFSEPLGDRTNVFFSLPTGEQLVARLSADARLDAGTLERLHLDLSQAHFFEPGDGGRNLTVELSDKQSRRR